jgi:polysaccharide pyruvyl transferase WcaK-like protein
VIIEIKGAQFANKGAHLMLLAVIERLRARLPHAEVALAPGPNAPYRERARLGAWQKLPLRRGTFDLTTIGYNWPGAVDRALARYGVVTEARIDALLDISGFAYGDRWGTLGALQAASELERFHRQGKPYLLLPQAFGPFSDPAARRFGAALAQAALVCVRDGESLEHLSRLNPALGSSLVRFPDLTIGVEGDPAAAGRWGIGPKTVLVIPNVRMLDSGKDAGAWQAGYLPLLEALIVECARRGYEVRVVNHAGPEDATLSASLARAAGGRAVVDEGDPLALKGLIGAAAAVVSSRYHGCVNALSQGVPCLGTSWSHKYGALFEDFGRGDSLVMEPDVPAATRLFARLLEQGRELSGPAARQRATLAVRVEEMWNRVFGVLSARAGP